MTTLETSAPPVYTSHPQDVELAHLDHSSSRSRSPSLLTAPPPYPAGTNTSNTSLSTSTAGPTPGGPFNPTLHFQIQTTGKPWLSLPLPSRPDPIPIFSLHPDDSSLSASAHSSSPYYTCLRPERSSGSCYLTTGGSSNSGNSSNNTIPVTSSTTYRFGPNRPPVVRLFAPHTPPLPVETLNQLLYNKNQDVDVNGAGTGTSACGAWDTFTINSLGLLTRSIGFRSRLGYFEWRYAGRKERHAAAGAGIKGVEDLNSVLVLERVVKVARALNGASSSSKTGKDEEVRTVVAQFLRGEGCRTPGSGSSTAGNGGRLVMDLGGLEKGEREMAVALVVTTCLVMMKREVDRRRAQQIAIMAGAAGGN
ncbi:uncharacterized protein C8A04DRAFT_34968 [Dichotomopilus funicola]|uniref:Uncharacterized protein n=1 Tax=Dichotomopilus funicola TaxID=1934379 RepID=A0AAN6V8P4_9PEZI|nr:hypothetical protein C8A04DRAFT_34968 [Dichotomopilus funicola]